MVDGSGVELSSFEKEVQKVLKWAMRSTCLMCEVSFQGLLKAVQQSDEDRLKGASFYRRPTVKYSSDFGAHKFRAKSPKLAPWGVSFSSDLLESAQAPFLLCAAIQIVV